MPIVETICPVERVTDGPYSHFFGYYDRTPWDRSGRHLLALRLPHLIPQSSRNVQAIVGLVDLDERNRFLPVGQTSAWNWQQGAMVQWIGPAPNRRIIYNTRTDRACGAVVRDLDTGREHRLPLPVYAVSPDGQTALTVDFARLSFTHPTIGYAGVATTGVAALAPADSGIVSMDLHSGESRAIISFEQLALLEPEASMKGAVHWCSHLAYNPSGGRFLFLHRWSQRVEDQSAWFHRMLTANPDGTEITLLESTGRHGREATTRPGPFEFQAEEYGYLVSHPTWRDDAHILAWAHHGGETCYRLYQDSAGHVSPLGADVLTENGHCTFGPTLRWLLTDTYPDPVSSACSLFLYDVDTGTRVDIGRFPSPPATVKENRCDLHPRWNRDGRSVCIDSTHEGGRQMYVIDVSAVVD